MNMPLFVMATGARTPLGLHSAAAAAAVRSAISSCREHPFLVDRAGDPMPASLDVTLEPGLPCRERMSVLAQSAIAEAMDIESLSDIATVPLLLGLPEPRPGFDETDAHWVRNELLCQADFPFAPDQTRAYMSGNSSTLYLIDLARREMAEGRYEVCLVGGVDSYFHPDTMEWLDQNRQLVGSVSRSGFVPGEGAGFCLLMTPAAAQRAGLAPIARILGSATAWEANLIKTDAINLGEGLVQAVHDTVSVMQAQDRVNAIYCDINGERYRGEEWGFVCLKLARHFDDPADYCCAADCWGDMGAASGGLLLTLATQAAQRGYAAGRRSLLWTSSENGLRAAALLEADIAHNPFRG